nr:MAG TPA: hypothetical protein [Caudoviricetes sp.]
MRIFPLDLGVSHKRHCMGGCTEDACRPSTLR